jgi:hypothetical protein
MKRAALIARIDRMSDDELERVGPYLEADLDAVDQLESVQREIALGRASARDEPLVEHAAVMPPARTCLSAREAALVASRAEPAERGDRFP